MRARLSLGQGSTGSRVSYNDEAQHMLWGDHILCLQGEAETPGQLGSESGQDVCLSGGDEGPADQPAAYGISTHTRPAWPPEQLPWPPQLSPAADARGLDILSMQASESLEYSDSQPDSTSQPQCNGSISG